VKRSIVQTKGGSEKRVANIYRGDGTVPGTHMGKRGGGVLGKKEGKHQ